MINLQTLLKNFIQFNHQENYLSLFIEICHILYDNLQHHLALSTLTINL